MCLGKWTRKGGWIRPLYSGEPKAGSALATWAPSMKTSSCSQLLAIIAVGDGGGDRAASLPEEHRDDERAHGRVALRLVDGGTGLGDPEAVRHPCPLDGVGARAEHRGVVEPGPGHQPGVAWVGPGLALRLAVQGGLPGEQGRRVGPGEVLRLGLLHADRLGDQVGQAGERQLERDVPGLRVGPVVVVGEDVLVPGGVLVEGHRAGTRPRAVELPRGLPGRGPQPGEVRGLVEPGAPDDHRGTAPVPDHHVADVLHHEVLPGRGGAHVVPARRFLPDQQAELVAGVEEVR